MTLGRETTGQFSQDMRVNFSKTRTDRPTAMAHLSLIPNVSPLLSQYHLSMLPRIRIPLNFRTRRNSHPMPPSQRRIPPFTMVFQLILPLCRHHPKRFDHLLRLLIFTLHRLHNSTFLPIVALLLLNGHFLFRPQNPLLDGNVSCQMYSRQSWTVATIPPLNHRLFAINDST